MSLDEVKAQVKKDWTVNAAGWNKWNAQFVEMTRAATELIVREARVEPGMQVLDLASGTGEPALTLAGAVGAGQVTATDLVPEMLVNIEKQAQERHLANLRVEPADMEALPYGDASFDRVTSRFGIMFPPDTARALGEIHRVLKPGGRVAFIVWAAPTQPLFALFMGTFNKVAQLPAPPPDAPSPFRFARPRSLSEALERAGFHDVAEAAHEIPWRWPGTPEEAWRVQHELVIQLYTRFHQALTPDQFHACEEEVLAGLRNAYDGQRVNLKAQIYAVTALR